MKRLVIFILPAMLFLTACDKEKKGTMPHFPTPNVEVIVANPELVPIDLEFGGRFESSQDVVLVAEVAGTLKERFFKDGQSVKEGERLFLIDQRKYQAAYDIAKANVDIANAALYKSELDYQRAENLKNSNSISKREYDSFLLAYKTATANASSAKALLSNAKIDLDNTVVKAPFSGVVGSALKDVGTYITPANPTLVRLTKLDDIEVSFSIADREFLNIAGRINDSSWVKNNLVASVVIDGKEHKGKISFIDKTIDSKTGAIRAKALFKNDGTMVPGAFTRIKVSGLEQKDGYALPAKVLQQGVDGSYLYLLDTNSTVVKQKVEVGYEKPNYVVISRGLKPGDQVIADNFLKIRVGGKAQKVER